MQDRSDMAVTLGISTMLAPVVAGSVCMATLFDRKLFAVAIAALIAGPVVTLVTGVAGIVVSNRERRRARASQRPSGKATAGLMMSVFGLVGILGCGGFCALATFMADNADLKF